MKTKHLLLALAAVSAFCTPPSAFADVPHLINYQGRLRDNATGLPLNGTVQIRLDLFTNEVGGASQFTQNIGPVPVTNGVYSFAFGDATLPALLGQPEVWLQITADGNILVPRQRLLAVPYAVVAGTVRGPDLYVDSATGNVGVGTASPTARLDVHNGIHVHGGAAYAMRDTGIEILKINDELGTISMVDARAFPLRLQKELRLYGWPLSFFVGQWGEVARISTNACVGIGTSEPLAKLHISSDGADALWVKAPSSQRRVGIGQLNNVMQIWAYQDGVGNADLAINTDVGRNVGIGTSSPSEKLDVAGNIKCVSLQQTSDARLKMDLKPITAPLEAVRQLRGVEFSWNQPQHPTAGFDDRRHLGLLAQEVEHVLPQTVTTAPDGTKSLDYQALIPVLVEAVKAQQAKIEQLERAMERMQKAMEDER